jgi:hypothetical protein
LLEWVQNKTLLMCNIFIFIFVLLHKSMTSFL